MSNLFQGKVALVTAGASGIGRSTVEAFAREGAHVVIADLHADAGEAVAHHLREHGYQALFIETDVTQPNAVARMVETTVSTFGRLDIAFNNVGGEPAAANVNDQSWNYVVPAVHDMTEAHWHDTVDLNLTSIWLSMKYELQVMVEQGGGAIVNTTSIAGLIVGQIANPAYSAAKAGMIHLSRYAAAVYGQHNIRINVVAPGLTATPPVLTYLPEEWRESAVAGQPIPQMVQPEDLAEAVLWLCSDRASKVTGHIIPVDAGATLR